MSLFLHFIEPCLLTLVDRAPSGDRWVHEIKHDGYRLMVRVDAGTVEPLTRSGLDWTSRFPWIAEAAAALPVENAHLDGEVVVEDQRGHSAPQLAQLLDMVARPTHPFAEPLPRRQYPGAVWLEPTFRAEIDFRGWSGDGLFGTRRTRG